MFGLTPLGLFHTGVALVALLAGAAALLRSGEIMSHNALGRVYIGATVVTCLTGFGLFQHDGFGAEHALGLLVLVVLGLAAIAEYTPAFGRLSRYVAALGYSATFLFHFFPAVTETATRLPPDHPLLASADAPALRATLAVLTVLFLIGTCLQVRRLRARGGADGAAQAT